MTVPDLNVGCARSSCGADNRALVRSPSRPSGHGIDSRVHGGTTLGRRLNIGLRIGRKLCCASAAVVCSLTWASTAPAQGLPACGPNVIGLGPAVKFVALPAQIAPGRNIPFAIDDNTGGDGYVGEGSLTMAVAGQPPFYGHAFDAAENQLVSDYQDNNGPAFFIELDPGDPPATVTMSYRTFGYPTDCIRSIQSIVSVTSPHAAAPRFASNAGESLDDGSFTMRVDGGCHLGSAGTTTVQLSGYGRTRTLRLADLCGSWSPRSATLPGLRIVPDDYKVGAYPALIVKPTKTRRYRVTVSFAGRVVARRILQATYNHYPATRVYEGTDRFVNFCINETKKIYSSNLRLYCLDPPFTYRDITFRRP